MTEKRLLAQYVSERSQAAFSALAQRHMGMVYSACLRELGDHQLAEDATQAVFVLLAKKAPVLTSGVSISGWLFTTARNVARGMRRMEHTRQRHEWEAAMNRESLRESDRAWNQMEPFLNDALSTLQVSDRDIVLMRFFEGLSVREVAEEIGTTEDTAAKRLSRAIERLRLYFKSREVPVTSAVLSASLLQHAGFDVPHKVAAAIGRASLSVPKSGAAAHPFTSLFAKGLSIVSTTKLIAGATAAVILILAVTFVVIHKLHSAPASGVVWQAPPVYPGGQPSQVVWSVPPASDPATQQAQQQIQYQVNQYVSGFVSGDAQREIAVLSPGFTFNGFNNGQPHVFAYSEWVKWLSIDASLPRRSANLTVTSCSIVGNTATVQISGPMSARSRTLSGVFNGMILTFTNTGGKWLMTTGRNP